MGEVGESGGESRKGREGKGSRVGKREGEGLRHGCWGMDAPDALCMIRAV